MRYFHKTNNKFFCPTINLDKIWTLVDEEVRSYCFSVATTISLQACTL
jgi:hypothetical protein